MAAFIAQSAMWYMHFVHFGKVIPQKRQVYPCCAADGPVTDLHMSRIRFSLPERSYPTYLPDIGPYPVPPLCSPKACMKLFSRASMGMAAKSEAQVPQGIHRGMSFLQPWHLKPLPPTRKSAGVLGARSTLSVDCTTELNHLHTVRGSFSPVSTLMFAAKFSLESS